MEQNEEIPILLRRVHGKPKVLSLINTYKSLPISYPTTLFFNEKESIYVRSEPLQIVCLAREGYTFIKGNVLPLVVKATVKEVDFIKLEAQFTDFSYVIGNIGTRMQVRVEPRESVIGLLYTANETKNAICNIVDLSLDGLGIHLLDNIDVENWLPVGMSLTILFRLPIESDLNLQTVSESMPYSPPLEKDYRLFRQLLIPAPLMKYPSIWGKVSSSREIHSSRCMFHGLIANVHHYPDHHRYRLGIRLFPGSIARSILSKYIVQRQSEIIHELRDQYDLLSWLVANENILTISKDGDQNAD